MKVLSNLSMDINKGELLKLLSAYYSEKLGKDIQVKVDVTKELKGYGMGEYMDTSVSFYYVTEENIASSKVKITTSLSEEDIKESLSEIVSKLNYTVDDMSYKKGTRSVGYYMDEHEEAYFSGITLSIRQKGIEKKLK